MMIVDVEHYWMIIMMGLPMLILLFYLEAEKRRKDRKNQNQSDEK